MIREVLPGENIPPAIFLYRHEFMGITHNYLCAVCREKKAVIECWHGILQPCWDCQKKYKLLKLNWLDRLFKRGEP